MFVLLFFVLSRRNLIRKSFFNLSEYKTYFDVYLIKSRLRLSTPQVCAGILFG